MPSVEVVTWSLETRAPAELRPRRSEAKGLRLVEVTDPSPALGRFLYDAVGRPHHWIDRADWSDEQWRRRLGHPQVETWVLHAHGDPAGYFELDAREPPSCEIAYLGLLPRFVGRGLGGHLVTAAVERAWALPGIERVWVHTCSLDAEHALANYRARGFQVFREDRHTQVVPPAG